MPGSVQAIKSLGPYHGGVLEKQPHNLNTSCPDWGLQRLSSSRCQSRHIGDSTAGLRGQAVLVLPVHGADMTVKLPPGLKLATTQAGRLDCRMELLGLQLDWPAGHMVPDKPGSSQATVKPAQSSLTGFAVRSGALVLAHALFPDHTHNLLAWIAVPVTVADTIGALAAAAPSSAQEAVCRKALQLKRCLQRHNRANSSGRQGVDWVDGLQGVVAGSLHSMKSMSGPAAAMATASWLWGLVSPSSHMLCSALIALMAVAADYNHLGRDVAKGKIPPGKAVEAAWRVRHKAAAQRLAVYCRGLPSSPPLAPVLDLSRCCSIAAGLAVGGQGLLGYVPAAMTGTAGTACRQPNTWCDDCSSETRLLVTGSLSRRVQPELHKAAGLSRSQLLELFTGSTHDHVIQTAARGVDSPSGQCISGGYSAPPGVPDTGVQKVDDGTAGGLMAVPCVHGHGDNTSQPSLAVSQEHLPHPPAHVCCAGPRQQVASCQVGLGSWGSQGAEPTVDALIHIKQPVYRGDKGRIVRSKVDSSSSSSTNSVVDSIASSSSDRQPAPCSLSVDSDTSPGGMQGGLHSCSSSVFSSRSAGAPIRRDPLAFLDELPLYGQQDHTHSLAAQAGQPGVPRVPRHSKQTLTTGIGNQSMSWLDALPLSWRAMHLLLVFMPFWLVGVPMLLMAWWLLTRAEAAQHHQVPSLSEHSSRSLPDGAGSSARGRDSSPAVDKHHQQHDAGTGQLSLNFRASAMQAVSLAQHPSQFAVKFLQSLWRLLVMLAAVLDLMLVLLLGGHWTAGVSAWESAGMWLRKQAWMLLHFSCSKAGAAFIKWGQWSSTRRDIFPADFCDTLSVFHHRAPVHSYRHSRREIKAAFSVDVEDLFASFDRSALASGSIAQVHRATLRPEQYKRYLLEHLHAQLDLQQHHLLSSLEEEQQVVVKVCHPHVAEHIRQDFQLMGVVSAALSKLPLLRGLPLRESVAQFSQTMTAQTDLRVEAVHALRFHNNFAGVQSSVSIPRPIPGLASSTVLVESYEEGQGVSVFMNEHHPINPQIVALGVDAYLKMLLMDNFVHTDLHPGNILFRTVPAQKVKHTHQLQQHPQRSGWPPLLPWKPRRTADSTRAAQTADDSQAAPDMQEMPQWEQELLQLAAQHQQRWSRKHGSAATGSSAKDQEGSSSSSSSGCVTDSSSSADQKAQLVLLDFGLAEQLTVTVRHHFICFLTAISAGDGLAAAHHLLSWSNQQTCPDRHAFGADMVDLFTAACDISSPDGIDLNHVMTAVLSLARKHFVAIDSCYASLVISVCVLVGFAKALDPAVNLMDAATPTLLAYALTGKVVGRLYS